MDLSIPGAKGQPPVETKGPSFNSMGWLHTTNPKTDYVDRQGNPGQLTAPMSGGPFNSTNDSKDYASLKTTNEINGGRTIFQGGGTG